MKRPSNSFILAINVDRSPVDRYPCFVSSSRINSVVQSSHLPIPESSASNLSMISSLDPVESIPSKLASSFNSSSEQSSYGFVYVFMSLGASSDFSSCLSTTRSFRRDASVPGPILLKILSTKMALLPFASDC